MKTDLQREGADTRAPKSMSDLLEKTKLSRLPKRQHRVQYPCSFCFRELPDGGIRFNGMGACPSCDNLARLWADTLNCFSNLGVCR